MSHTPIPGDEFILFEAIPAATIAPVPTTSPAAWAQLDFQTQGSIALVTYHRTVVSGDTASNILPIFSAGQSVALMVYEIQNYGGIDTFTHAANSTLNGTLAPSAVAHAGDAAIDAHTWWTATANANWPGACTGYTNGFGTGSLGIGSFAATYGQTYLVNLSAGTTTCSLATSGATGTEEGNIAELVLVSPAVSITCVLGSLSSQGVGC